jgi:hypothetical protein
MAFTKEQQKLMSSLLEMEGAVVHEDGDVFSSGLESPSPSFNYCFDNSWCLPNGYTLLLGGQPKGGKSLLVSAMFGMLHRTDPDAVVMKYNTEGREKAQVTLAQLALWGIDPNRYRAYDTNLPEHIFDAIEQVVPKMLESGIKVRAIAIDSINDIVGRRAMNSDTVMKQQRGDEALTIQDGLKRIKGLLRRNGISLILTCQVRAEQDPKEQERGVQFRMAVPWYVKHTAEYFMMVERLRTKAGRTTLTGQTFRDETVSVDLTGENQSDGDELGHKIRVTMVDSSLGRPGRKGVFTLDHDRGIINTHEEVLLLGMGFGVIQAGGGGIYRLVPHQALDTRLKGYLDRSWKGKDSFLNVISGDKEVYLGILSTCKAIDLARKNGIVYDADGKQVAIPKQSLAVAGM